MRVHYPHGFLGPPVLNLAPKAVTHLFAEMDQVAAKLRAQPQFVQGDLQFAFYQLQRERIGNLSKDEWLWCFDLWCDHDRGQQVILDAEFAARLDALNDEREHLLNTRERFPEHRTELTARLYVIGCELAELMPKSPTAPLGEWVSNQPSRSRAVLEPDLR